MMFRPVRVAVAWTVGLVVVVLLPVLSGPRAGQAPLWFQLVLVGVTGAGSLLPFVAAVGGLAASGETPGRALRLNALLLALLTFGVAAYATPLLQAAALAWEGIVIADRFPFGPRTPGNLLEWRAAVLADPPAAYSLSVEQPLRIPPNWLGYHLYLPAALAWFAYLNVHVGAALRGRAERYQGPSRRYGLWAAVLAWNVSYFLLVSTASMWVRGAPTRSAMAGALLPIVIPLGVLWMHRVFRYRRGPDRGGG